MAYNVHAYNYIEGAITRIVPSNTSYKYYQFVGKTSSTNGDWIVEFESIKISSLNTNLVKCRYNSSSYGWDISINSDGHPVIKTKNLNGSGTYEITDITVTTNEWFSIKFEGNNSTTITCTYNNTAKTTKIGYRGNVNYHFDLVIGSSNTTIRGNIILQGYTYNSDTLYTGTINPDTVSVGATQISSTGTVNSFSCSAIKYFNDALQLKISDSWKGTTPYIKISGSWKQVSAVYLKQSGSWIKIM